MDDRQYVQFAKINNSIVGYVIEFTVTLTQSVLAIDLSSRTVKHILTLIS